MIIVVARNSSLLAEPICGARAATNTGSKAAGNMNSTHTMGRFPSNRSLPRVRPCSNHLSKWTKYETS